MGQQPTETRPRGRKRTKEHLLPGKVLRMADALWDFLERRKERSGVTVQEQLRQLVEQEARRAS